MTVAVVLVGLLLAGAVGALAWVLARQAEPLSGGGELAVLAARMEGVPQALVATREQLAALHERVGSVEATAGENICELVFAQLPAEWQERDFRIANRTVEFALRLPNKLVVPIDSKWPATPLLEQFLASEDPAEQQRLKLQIQQAVVAKAKEVRKYLDPGLTTDFGVAVVPDAVYELSGGALAEVMQLDVMLVSQSMFVPSLMLMFQSAVRGSREIDVERLAGYLKAADQGLDALSKEIEGRLSNAIVMLGNSRDSLRMQTARVSSGLAAITVPGESAIEVAEAASVTM
jgi:DNA recombination protein RmuC